MKRKKEKMANKINDFIQFLYDGIGFSLKGILFAVFFGFIIVPLFLLYFFFSLLELEHEIKALMLISFGLFGFSLLILAILYLIKLWS